MINNPSLNESELHNLLSLCKLVSDKLSIDNYDIEWGLKENKFYSYCYKNKTLQYNYKLEKENSNKEKEAEIFERYSAVAEYIKYVACEYNKEIKKEESIEEYTKNLF